MSDDWKLQRERAERLTEVLENELDVDIDSVELLEALATLDLELAPGKAAGVALIDEIDHAYHASVIPGVRRRLERSRTRWQKWRET